MPYIQVKLLISPIQQRKALKGDKIRLTADAISKGSIVMLHPLNARKVASAKKGINLELSPGEIMQTAAYHGVIPKVDPTDMDGAGIFDSIWSGIKKVGSFLKDTGIASTLADEGEKLLGNVVGEDIAKVGRNVLRGVTGVGLKKSKKGSGLYLGGKGLYM